MVISNIDDVVYKDYIIRAMHKVNDMKLEPAYSYVNAYYHKDGIYDNVTIPIPDEISTNEDAIERLYDDAKTIIDTRTEADRILYMISNVQHKLDNDTYNAKANLEGIKAHYVDKQYSICKAEAKLVIKAIIKADIEDITLKYYMLRTLYRLENYFESI